MYFRFTSFLSWYLSDSFHFFCSDMTNYNNDAWLGCMANLLVRNCVNLSIQRCPGCKVKLKSPALHLHHQHSLLDKMRLYFEEVRGLLLPAIEDLYNIVKQKLPHSQDPVKDREIYCNSATFFLTTANPESVYWGRYVDESTDSFIHSLIPISKKKTSEQVDPLF